MLDRIKNICIEANAALKEANKIDKNVDKLTLDQKAQITKTLEQLNTSQTAIKNYRVPFLRRLFCLLIGERGIGTKVNNAIQDLNLLNQKPVEEKKAEEKPVEQEKVEEPKAEEKPIEEERVEEPEVEVKAEEKPIEEEQVEEAEVEVKAEEKPIEEEQVEEAEAEKPEVEVKAEEKPVEEEQVEEPKVEVKAEETQPKDLWRAAQEATKKEKEAEDKRKEKLSAEFAGVDPEKPGPGTPAVRSKTPQKLGKIAEPPQRPTIRKEEFENLDPTKKGPSVTDRLKGWWTKQ